MNTTSSEPTLSARVEEAAAFVRGRHTQAPEVGVILGSGLGGLADHVANATAIPYSQIPGFLKSTVEGHKGQLLLGTIEGRPSVVMQGRFHYYEGYSLDQVTFPVRVMKALGIKTLIVSNACGGVNRLFKTGDLMVISDVINWMFANPLRGPNDAQRGPRFPDMSEPFCQRLIDLALQVGVDQKTPLRLGTYLAVTGPSYETRAELRMFGRLGADAVGMSTVPEVIVARHEGIKQILGISCITDMATGESVMEVTHDDVIKAAAQAGPAFVALVREIIRRL